MTGALLKATAIVLATTSLGWAGELAFPFTREHDLGGLRNPEQLEAVDLDGDGDLDLLAGHGDGLSWFQADGRKHQGRVIDDTQPTIRHARAVDLDGDGDLDVIATGGGASETTGVRCYLNVGRARAWEAVAVDAELGQGWMIDAGDVDGDGDLDLVVAGGWELVWYENAEGDGKTWIKASSISAAFDKAGPRGVAVQDFDGDGDVDVAASAKGSDGGFAWFENSNGGETWTEHSLRKGLDGDSIRAADFDADGDMDLVGHSSGVHTILAFENVDGKGHFADDQVTDELTFVNVVRLADLDGDGDLDLAAVGDKVLAWFERDGSSYTKHVVGTGLSFDSITGLVIGDLDHDGDPDIGLSAYASAMVRWLENRSKKQ